MPEDTHPTLRWIGEGLRERVPRTEIEIQLSLATLLVVVVAMQHILPRRIRIFYLLVLLPALCRNPHDSLPSVRGIPIRSIANVTTDKDS